MSKLFVITGPAGVGKSTISKKLAESLIKSVYIQGDDIYGHVIGGYASPWKENNHLKLCFKVSIDVIKDYLEAGYDVVFDYIIENQDFELFKNEFKNYEAKFVVLMADEETLLKRDALRPVDCQMKNRCIELLQMFHNYNYDERFIIDTSKVEVEDIVNTIKCDSRFVI